MTPRLVDLLLGHAASLSVPQPPESGGDYLAGRLGMMALMSVLMAQEAERGVAARVWENRAVRETLRKAAQAYDVAFEGRLALAAAGIDHDLDVSALDRSNADLRRLLIGLHETAEVRGDTGLDGDILTLYRAMAHRRRLEFPAAMLA